MSEEKRSNKVSNDYGADQIQVLEGLHPDDAALLCRMKDKGVKIKKAALQEAFPKEQW